MTIDEENRRNILSKLPNELLQTKECKLVHSWINSTPYAAWRYLTYHKQQHDLKAIDITITHKVYDSYFVVIKVYISGVKYDYFNAPKNKYVQVDIAYQIANYLKILGLHVNDH